jgi:PAS domain S-box-containing protein
MADTDESLQDPELRELRQAQEVVASLAQRGGDSPPPLLAEAITELETTLEELSVALHELREQNEELLEARGAMEVAREYYQQLFDLAPDAYVITDTKGLLRAGNQAALRLLHVPRWELPGRPLAAFVPPEDSSEFRRQMARAVEAGGRTDWSFRLVPRGRSAVLVAASLVAGTGLDGQPDVRWLLRDVTDARRAQDLLRERFARSSQEAQALRELDRWKDAFMAAAAHDLRTPLTVIDTATQTMLERDELTSRQHDRLTRTIGSQATRLRRLLDDLLDLDRFTRGDVTPDRGTVDVQGLVERVVGQVPLDEHPVTVTCPSITAELDGPRIEQILANLVANAVRHTPTGTPIRVEVESDADHMRLVVEDEGPGFDPDLGDEIFRPFVTRARHAGEEQGTGIGLSLVQLFTELHGGSVHAELADGGGARFVVELPVRPPPPEL